MKNYLIVLSIQVLLLFFCTSCYECTDKACNGGFLLKATTFNEEELLSGEYSIFLWMEEEMFEITYHLDNENNNFYFNYPEEVPDNIRFNISALKHNQDDPNKGPIGLSIDAIFLENNNSIRGPSYFALNIMYEGIIVTTAEFWPEYKRDKEYWGSKKCGYCELRVVEKVLMDL